MEFIIVLIFGMIWGSFLNVCVYRIPLGISIIMPRSFCPNCNERIKFYDLIPVISFLILQGRCRSCNLKISFQYPIIELITGVLTVLVYLRFGVLEFVFKYLVFIYLLIIIAVIDLKYKRIFNILSVPGIIIGLFWAVLAGRAVMYDAALGMVLGGGILLPIAYFYPQGMGMGDVKLLALIGAFLGVKSVLFALFIGSALGTVLGLTLIFFKVITRKTPIPFGPFLVAGAISVVLLFKVGG